MPLVRIIRSAAVYPDGVVSAVYREGEVVDVTETAMIQLFDLGACEMVREDRATRPPENNAVRRRRK
jgi:hypothetical protein